MHTRSPRTTWILPWPPPAPTKGNDIRSCSMAPRSGSGSCCCSIPSDSSSPLLLTLCVGGLHSSGAGLAQGLPGAASWKLQSLFWRSTATMGLHTAPALRFQTPPNTALLLKNTQCVSLSRLTYGEGAKLNAYVGLASEVKL